MVLGMWGEEGLSGHLAGHGPELQHRNVLHEPVKPRGCQAKASHHTQTRRWLGHILHGGNELTKVFFLVKSWLPPKNASPSMSQHREQPEPGEEAGDTRWRPGVARPRAASTQMAPLAFQSLTEAHPDSGITIPALLLGCLGLRNTPGSGEEMWKCKRAMSLVIAVQMLGAGRRSQVWGSP